MVQLEFNITVIDGKMSIMSNVLSREDANNIERDAANGIEQMVIATTRAISEDDNLLFRSEFISPVINDEFCPICCMQNDEKFWCRCDTPNTGDAEKLLRRIYTLIGQGKTDNIQNMIAGLFRRGVID